MQARSAFTHPTSRRWHHWLVGAIGAVVVGIHGWAALQSDPVAPFDMYLLRIAFLCGALGAGAAVLLHRGRGWPLTVPRVLGFAAIAALLLGPAGARMLGLEDPAAVDLVEWLQLGLFGGLGFSMLVFGWRGESRPPDGDARASAGRPSPGVSR